MFWPFKKKSPPTPKSPEIHFYQIWYQGHREAYILATSRGAVADYINHYYRNESWYGSGTIDERLAKRAQLIRRNGEQNPQGSKWYDLGPVLPNEASILQKFHLATEVYHEDSLKPCVDAPVYFEVHDEDRETGIAYTLAVYDAQREHIGYLVDGIVVSACSRRDYYSMAGAKDAAKKAKLAPLPKLETDTPLTAAS
ncbi:MAG: hypothetical protein UZ21_OP11001000582 [Microgenomates bacterium OLB22]|nr:MAG: hypothetical protein UZ21_OP11001000582 [Microgenomates bacterium OLB22]